MNIIFTEIKDTTELSKIKALYHKAFPIHERVPLWLLYLKRKRENTSFYSIYDGEVWIGFVYFLNSNDLLFLWYLAVDDNIRSKGYGGLILSELKKMYSEHRIILAIEVSDKNARNNEQRIKRKQFYQKHGFKESGYIVEQKPPMEVLLFGESFFLEEFYGLIKKFDKIYGIIMSLFGKFVIKKLN
jgi:GNAT superfamily N-acetyltransferase